MAQRSKTQIVNFLISLVLLIGLSNQTFAQPQGAPLSEIQNTLTEMQAQLSNLQTSVNNVQNDVDGLEIDVSNLQIDVLNLQTAVEGIDVGVDLRGVTQNWDKKLDATNGCNSDRFTCLWGDTAVRDNETGLVWDRAPDTTARTWHFAIHHCAQREVGGRKGWSLPMREQLATLVDTSNNNPTLPTGHPFLNVQSARYWAASLTPDSSNSTFTFAWLVDFVNGNVGNSLKDTDQLAWCVRGGQAFDGQEVQNVINHLP
jgi:hypothetical protein